jgi:hypothetical protein
LGQARWVVERTFAWLHHLKRSHALNHVLGDLGVAGSQRGRASNTYPRPSRTGFVEVIELGTDERRSRAERERERRRRTGDLAEAPTTFLAAG